MSFRIGPRTEADKEVVVREVAAAAVVEEAEVAVEAGEEIRNKK